MRDYILLSFILIGIPLSFYRAYWGTLYWAWISFMNPHRYTWATSSMPIATWIAGATLVGFLFTNEKRWPRWSLPIIVLIVLWVYYLITTTQALNPEGAWYEFNRVTKMIIMALVTLSLCLSRSRFVMLTYVVALSLGLLGFKGAIFSILSGGKSLVWGPQQSFIADNNNFALALNMILPILFYLAKNARNTYVKAALYGLFVTCIISIIFTYSRGGFLGLLVVLLLLAWHSKQKLKLIPAIGAIAVVALFFIPEEYKNRISTIENYNEDRSLLGRFNSWQFAVNLAKDRPLLGGGFRSFTPEIFTNYAPDPNDFHDAHSIYFEVLGEHGFLALFLFLTIFATAFFYLYKTRELVRHFPAYSWAVDYSRMLEIGLVGYLVCGLALGLANFDLQYHFILSAVALRTIVWEDLRDGILQQMGASAPERPSPVPA